MLIWLHIECSLCIDPLFKQQWFWLDYQLKTKKNIHRMQTFTKKLIFTQVCTDWIIIKNEWSVPCPIINIFWKCHYNQFHIIYFAKSQINKEEETTRQKDKSQEKYHLFDVGEKRETKKILIFCIGLWIVGGGGMKIWFLLYKRTKRVETNQN